MRGGFTLIELLVVLVMFSAATAVVVPAIARPATTEARMAGNIGALLHWTYRQAAARAIDGRFALDTQTGEFWIGADADWPLDIWRTGSIGREPKIDATTNEDGLITIRVGSTGAATTVQIVVGAGEHSAAVSIPDTGTWPHVESRWHRHH